MSKTIKRRTKIVATISDMNCGIPYLEELYQNGMDVVRLNTAHQDFEASMKIITNVRKVSDKIALLIDTKGPEIRTLPMDKGIDVLAGDTVLVVNKDASVDTKEHVIHVNYNGFANDIGECKEILIDDGEIALFIKEVHENYLTCSVENEGTIKGRKSINVPEGSFNLPSLSKKDISYIQFAIENDVEFIAHSFVRKKEDLIAIQDMLDAKNSKIKLISKIENREGVDNIDEILDHTYGVMVARGDLAIEIPYEQIPGIQKELVKKCVARRKPVIIATQMLHSMIKNPRPTRAEVTDIASAIYSHTDAIMLSGETAYGDYGVEAVTTMSTVAHEVEKSKEDMYDAPAVVLTSETSAFLSQAAVMASNKLNAKAVVADTWSGRTIRNISAFRGRKPVYAICYNPRVMRELALSYGVHPHIIIRDDKPGFRKSVMDFLKEANLVKDEDLLVFVAGSYGHESGASFMEISTALKLSQH